MYSTQIINPDSSNLFTGLTSIEILFGQLITQFLVIFGQSVMVLIVSFAIFSVTCEGDIGWITTLTVLTGLCGMCFGNSFYNIQSSYIVSLIPKNHT